MLSNTSLCRCAPYVGASFSAIREGRQQLAQQFSSMSGWQRGEDQRFDEYVEQKRLKERFDGFDQRVERAYRISAKMHKQEIVNSFKRRLVSSSGKFNPTVMREMQSAVDERAEWLRDVFAQIDADYRSTDTERHKRAAQEISDAIQGNPSDFMAYVYDQKRERRFAGEKAAAAMDADAEDANLPRVSDDEANRYHALRTNMLELERSVKAKFGVAGQRHWALLQQEKDTEYDQKLDAAVATYKELLKQDERYQMMKSSSTSRNELERRHLAQVRFKGAMELENEREKLIEAHKQMENERRENAKAAARAKLLDVAQMRRDGKTSQEILTLLEQQKLEKAIRKQDSHRKQERTEMTAKRTKFMDLIQSLKETFEARDGERALQRSSHNPEQAGNGDDRMMARELFQSDRLAPRPKPFPSTIQNSSSSKKTAASSAFAFPDEEDPAQTSEGDLTVLNAADVMARKITEDKIQAASRRGAETSPVVDEAELAQVRRQMLWQLVHQDRHEDPFITVHQARLDAAKTQDQILAKSHPFNFALGSRRVSKQGSGEGLAQANERKILKKPQIYNGTADFTGTRMAHYLDTDPSVEYGVSSYGVRLIRDPKTFEADTRYQRRSGETMLRGPRFYKIGAEREAKDPGNWPIHAAPKKSGGISAPLRSE